MQVTREDYEEQCDLIDSVSTLTRELTTLREALAIRDKALSLSCEAIGDCGTCIGFQESSLDITKEEYFILKVTSAANNTK